MKRSRTIKNQPRENEFAVYKGYPVRKLLKKKDLNQHFIVPWEMNEESQKKMVH